MSLLCLPKSTLFVSKASAFTNHYKFDAMVCHVFWILIVSKHIAIFVVFQFSLYFALYFSFLVYKDIRQYKHRNGMVLINQELGLEVAKTGTICARRG